MELSDELLKEYGFVICSKYRFKVMKILYDYDVKMPSSLARESGILQNNIPRILNELKSHSLIECVNPEFKRGRLYRLTEKGEKIAKCLDNFPF